MKKHRKQLVYIDGQKHLIDVPVDDELYKADNHEEYLRARSRSKESLLEDAFQADETVDIMKDYEEKQLMEHLYEALQNLTKPERELIDHLYFKQLTERETAKLLGISHQAVGKRKHKVIQKLRDSLSHWQS